MPNLKIDLDGDEIELEESLHDHDEMKSMAIIENEIEVMNGLI